jgi:hypothetical protein
LDKSANEYPSPTARALLTILRSVFDSSISVNIQKIYLITDYLRNIPKALLQAESHL